MTTEELSDLFDVLVSSYRRFKDFDNKEELDSLEFNEYEKSVFLTKALLLIVTNLYNGRLTGESFEKTEELRSYLQPLVKGYYSTHKLNVQGISVDSLIFELPNDIMFKIYEAVSVSSDDKCTNGKELEVTPVTHDEYHKLKENPFRRANERRALRLDFKDYVEIVSPYNLDQYFVRYIAYPQPIILEDLPNNLTIDNLSTKSECLLNPAIHRTILELAVNMAMQSKVGAKQDV